MYLYILIQKEKIPSKNLNVMSKINNMVFQSYYIIEE